MAKISGISTGSIRDLKLENAGTWPIPIKTLAYALAAAAGFGLIFYFFVMKVMDDIEVVERNIDNVNKEIVKLEATVKRFEGQEEIVNELLFEIAEASKILPLQQEQPQLIDDVAENALAADLDLLEFRPGTEVAQEQFYELPISLRFSGEYSAIGDFMAKVSSMERLVIPTSLNVNQGADGKLSGDLVLKTFRFRESSVIADAGT